MMLKTFKGGIKPAPNKDITLLKEFSNLAVPRVCFIPLKQHSGSPARPVVKAGDLVREGQLIARAEGLKSANIHSSIPGRVIDISNHPGICSEESLCAVIETDGRFSSSGKSHETIPWQNINKDILLERIAEAGIIDTGEETIPVFMKLSPGQGKKISHLIINACESEPYLTSFDVLLRTYPNEIIEGLAIARKILGLEKAYIGIDYSKSPAFKNFKEITDKSENILLVPLKTKYPQGSERMLIKSILKKEIPADLPAYEAGIAVLSIDALYFIREAILFDKPVFERFVTITGRIVNKPGNYKIRIGTRISDIIEECGGLKENPGKIIMGGPLSGKALESADVPVTKETRGILFLSEKEARTAKSGPCIKCGQCASVCPMRLLPREFEKISNGLFHNGLNPFDCILCGACDFACPSARPLMLSVKTVQEKMRNLKSA